MLSPYRDLTAAKLFLRLALHRTGQIRPRVINVDGHPAYARAISELKDSRELGRRCRCRPSPYLNNVLEQDHRFIKKRIAASLGFRSVEGALRTIDGYEAMHMIRKGQVRWLEKGDVIGQIHFIQRLLGIAAKTFTRIGSHRSICSHWLFATHALFVLLKRAGKVCTPSDAR